MGLRFRREAPSIPCEATPDLWFIRSIGGIVDSRQTEEVIGFHPEGITAISRGLSVRDTPGEVSSKWDLHPEGMLAGSGCPPDGNVLASLQDANHLDRTLPGVSRTLNPRLIADIPSG